MPTTTTLPKTNLNIDVASLSDRGKKRSLNEDAIFDFTTTQAGTQAGLYMVCDGRGGYMAGDVASQLAVETVVAEMVPVVSKCQAMKAQDRDFPAPEVQRYIADAVSKANQRIYSYNQEEASAYARTTLTMAFLQDQEAIVANVGDSRAYIWHKGQLTQITHSDSIAIGAGDEQEFAVDAASQELWTTNQNWEMGLNHTVKVELFEWELEAGDKLLLCSDGLWQAFADEEELAAFLYRNRDAHDICQELVFEANRRDGSNNISVVVICAECC